MQFPCVSSLHTTQSLTIVPPLPSPTPSIKGRKVVPGTANYHSGFPHWPHLGLREGGVTYPSAQQETAHQLQEHWGCSMDLAWQRLQEGTQLLLLCLLRTLKKKKNRSQHHTPAPHRPSGHVDETCTNMQPHRRQPHQLINKDQPKFL